MPGRSYVSSGKTTKYKFTGKERDTESNLDYFGARYYDSEIGRWLSVDPLADKYPGWSPYNYCLNNPIKLIDYDGKEPGPGDQFNTPDDAAKDWVKTYGMQSYNASKEFGQHLLIINIDNGPPQYTYLGSPVIGGYKTVNINEALDRKIYGDKTLQDLIDEGKYIIYARMHTHHKGTYFTVNSFSEKDISICNFCRHHGYLLTHKGDLIKYDYKTKKIKPVEKYNFKASGIRLMTNKEVFEIKKKNVQK